MTQLLRITILLAAVGALGACASLQFFADSDHELITSASLDEVPPTDVRLDVKFVRKGVEITGAETTLRHDVINALNATSVLRASDDPDTRSVLSVEVVDYFAEGEQPNGDYLLSGLTEGSVPTSRITDRYEFKLRYKMANGHERFGSDSHAIWTKSGNQPAPSLRGPYSTSEHAFQAVVTDVVLSFLKNINLSGNSVDSVIFVPDNSQ